MVVMQEGELAKHEYRRFKLRGFSSQTGDDLRNLREILVRRFSHSEWRYPDLVVIDGGEVHRQFSERELKKRGLEIPVISVVKDERHRPKDVLGESKMVKDYYRNALALNAEAHRFAITYHKRIRDRID
jgi:excinuclease ABC subunit C